MKTLKVFMFNGIILILSSIFFQIVGTIFNVYISNKIGEEALGLFSIIMSVYFFGITLATSGINLAAVRLVSEELASNNENGVKKAANRCLIFGMITGIITSILFLAFSDFILNNCLHNRITKKVIYLLCFSFPFIAMTTAMNGYFVGVRRAYKNVISKFLEETIEIIIVSFLIYLGMPKGIEYACYSLILGDLVSEIIAFLSLYIMYIRDKKQLIKGLKYRDLDSYNKRILKITIPMAITSYIKSGLSTLKQILIPICLEKSGLEYGMALSKYGAFNGMAMPIIMFPCVFIGSFSTLIVPEISRLCSQNKKDTIKVLNRLIVIATMLFSVVINIILFFYGDKICNIIYINKDIGEYVKILSFVVAFIYIDIVFDNILKGIGCESSVMIINLIDVLISISCIYFLVPRFGFYGYIICIYISEILNFILSYIILKRKIKK